MPNDLGQATAAALKRRDHQRADPASNSPEPDAQGSETYDNRTHSSSFRQIKKKAVQFKCGSHLLTIATFGFSYPRVSSDTPSFAAFTPVAPGVRFNALAIFLTPIFCFASDFNSRTSFLVHSRLTTFFFAFLAMSAP